MGTNFAPLVSDLFLYCYERDFMDPLNNDNQADVIEAFNSTSKKSPRTSSIVQIIFFLSFGISEYIWSVSNILYVKNHLLNSILIIWPLWEYKSLI